MLAVQPAQPRHLGVDTGLFDDHGISGRDGLHLRVSERRPVNILDAPQVALPGHHLGDEPCLGFERLPHVGVEGFLGDITADLNFGICVSLAENPPLTLFDIRRAPRRIQMMQRNQALLHVGPGAHLLGAAKEDAHPAGANGPE